MSTQYLLFDTEQAANDANQLYWERVLGRDKSPEDTTTHLCAMMTNPTTDESMLIVDDGSYAMFYPKLTEAEQNNFDNNAVGEDDPRVIAIKESQPKPPALPPA